MSAHCQPATRDRSDLQPDWAGLQGRLACPDDGAVLDFQGNAFACRGCGRRFPLLAKNVVELLPKSPFGKNTGTAAYWEQYVRELQRPFQPDAEAQAWGAPETTSAEWSSKRRREVARVLPLVLEDGGNKLLCDVSAGAGYYTFAYAPHFQQVLHCDLSVDSLSYCVRKARRLGLENLFFLRIDYFSPPFCPSLDRVICFDTLIRGPAHERRLLAGIRKSLAPQASAVVDFHNWWHNPLRRLGLLPQNFGENRSYTRSQAEELLLASGIPEYERFEYHQECADGKASGLWGLLPPTRLIYRFRSAAC